MRKMNDNRGISQIVSALILIALVTVGGAAVYAVLRSNAATFSGSADFLVQSANVYVNSSGTLLSVTVKNTGSVDIPALRFTLAWGTAPPPPEPGNPDYVITNVNQLQEMNNDLDASYVLGNDIDASDTVNWNGGDGFVPVGSYSESAFLGSFDGRGYKIIDLYINRADYVGLFGYIGNGGVVKNVELKNMNASGYNCVGTLVGVNVGTVSNSCLTGSVSGTDKAGGVAGYNAGTVSNCYFAGSVYSQWGAGGLIGFNNFGTASNCYSTGSVNGYIYVGGLVGWNDSTISDSFWDTETSGQATSDGGTGKTTEEMKSIRTYTDTACAGLDTPWDFVGNPYEDAGTEDIWSINGLNNGYPYLSWQYEISEVLTSGGASPGRIASISEWLSTVEIRAGVTYALTVEAIDASGHSMKSVTMSVLASI